MAEVSQDRDGLDALVNIPNANALFDELAHSRNEAISTYASAIVIRLAEEQRYTESTSYIFPSHVESLNTPPLPMDTGEFDLIQPVQNSNYLGLSSSAHSQFIWSTNVDSQLYSRSLQIQPNSPPTNSLIEMLGPLPLGCKSINLLLILL